MHDRWSFEVRLVVVLCVTPLVCPTAPGRRGEAPVQTSAEIVDQTFLFSTLYTFGNVGVITAFIALLLSPSAILLLLLYVYFCSASASALNTADACRLPKCRTTQNPSISPHPITQNPSTRELELLKIHQQPTFALLKIHQQAESPVTQNPSTTDVRNESRHDSCHNTCVEIELDR